jgi:TonB family protein
VAGTKIAGRFVQIALISLVSLVQLVNAGRVVAQSSPSDAQPPPAAAQRTPSAAQPNSSGPQPTSSTGQPAGRADQSAPVQPLTNRDGTPASSAPPGYVQPNASAVLGPTPEELQKRVARARALAAAHQLAAAARELESVRALTGNDPVFREGTSVILMGIYLEDGNYVRAQSLLEETFQARATNKDASIRSFYALAGQAVNGLRSHVARYRNFGVGLANSDFPPEVASDLDRLRSMLERMIAQAKDMIRESPKDNDGLALLEDVLGLRTTVSRDSADRDRWQTEYSQAREQLGASRMEIASLRGAPPFVRPSPSPTPAPAATEKAAAPRASNPPVNTPADTAPTAPAIGQPMFVGSLNSRATKRVVPQYPQIAKSARIEGVVRVTLNVNENGDVEIVKTDGPPLLKQAAEDAARGWKFTPIVTDGKSIPMSGYIDFIFSR